MLNQEVNLKFALCHSSGGFLPVQEPNIIEEISLKKDNIIKY